MKNLRIVLLAFLLTAVLVMAWWFVLKPNSERNASMMLEIADKREKLKELNLAQGMVGDLQREILSYEAAIEYFQTKLPGEKDWETVVEEIWVAARTNALAPKTLKAQKAPKAPKVTQPKGKGAAPPEREFASEQPIVLELEGEYLGFYQFVQAVENQPRIMKITQMELARVDEKKWSGPIRAKLTMSIYFDGNKTAAPAPATPAPKAAPKPKGT